MLLYQIIQTQPVPTIEPSSVVQPITNITVLIGIITVAINLIMMLFNIIIGSKNFRLHREVSISGRVSTYISDKRVEWMQKLKQLVTEYINQTSKYRSYKPNEFKEHIDELLETTNKIRLHLNYNGTADSYILSNIYLINRLIELIIVLKPDNIHEPDTFGIEDEEHTCLVNIDRNYVMLFNSLKSNDYTKQEISQINETQWDNIRNDIGLVRGDYYSILLAHIWHFSEVVTLRNELVLMYSGIYLKSEWERSKFEVIHGESEKFNTDAKFELLLKKRDSEIRLINDRIKEYGRKS